MLSSTGEDFVLPPMRMSNAIRNCQANESIFHLLQVNKLFIVDDLTRLQLSLDDPKETKQLTDNLSMLYLLTAEEKKLLREMRDSNLSTYHGSSYLPHLCTRYSTNPVVPNIANQLRDYYTYHDGDPSDYKGYSTYHYYYWNAHVSFHNSRIDVEKMYNTYNDRLVQTTNTMKREVKKISELILYENLDFGDSIDILLSRILRAEKFIQERGKEFINNLAQNLTDAINSQIHDYIDMIISESNKNVGRCQHLAYIYYRGVRFVCERLVNPLNSAWVGLLLCSFLFLPILYVCHRLMCLYLVIYPGGTVTDGHDCQRCRARAYTPRPLGTDFPVGIPHPQDVF
ncbi:prominin-like protein [Drosophila miranda]|uniref:prominin-like protein n=1 Tax=Drosophila miranda TaxID=7229 RepID=UPI00143F4CB8|nr:prominin-like protein [Drosophila miranda]